MQQPYMPTFFIQQFGSRATQPHAPPATPHYRPNLQTPFSPAAGLHPGLTARFPPDATVPFHSFVGAPAAAGCAVSFAKILTGDIFEQRAFLSAPVLGGEGHHTRPTLKIQDGCDSRCSYCVIPFVRGKSRSLPPDTVIHEIQKLTVGQTFLSVPSDSLPAPFPAREIVLIGINLGTYGRDLSPRV